MKNNIHGVGVALVTPFDDRGEVDFDALGRLVRYVTEGGVDYLVALGTTAETPTLSAGEKRDIVACIKAANAGKLPLVVGIGGNSTRDVVENIRAFDLSGTDAVLSVTPYYNKPSQEGLYCHYETVAAESPVPVILYNVPGRTGVNMSAETTLRIARQVPNVLGVKEACGLIPQMARILRHRPEGFMVISGDDCFCLPLTVIGGDGVISVAANAFPREFCAMAHAAGRGENSVASELFMRLFEPMEALLEEGNPAGIKAALAIKGVARSGVRLPLVEASAGLSAKMERLISENAL
ncbi:MAG: 4-hydroxy-tetrahydrodipicolinate synthase [Alistipes sp.]|nr:4-hydroxy-tetrahydrodipicolinate synthase [Alistipes sp.]